MFVTDPFVRPVVIKQILTGSIRVNHTFPLIFFKDAVRDPQDGVL